MYTFTFPRIGERQYELNTEPSPAFSRLIELNRDEMLKRDDENDDAYGIRLYYWFTEDSFRFNEVIRMALAGNHDGIDWYRQGNTLELVDIISAYFSAVMPKAIKMYADLQKRVARAREQAASEVTSAEPTPASGESLAGMSGPQ